MVKFQNDNSSVVYKSTLTQGIEWTVFTGLTVKVIIVSNIGLSLRDFRLQSGFIWINPCS